MIFTPINWKFPKEEVPPFGKQILVVLGGQGSDDAGQTWETYFRVCNAIILRTSPNDDDKGSEFKEYEAEGGDFADFQFFVAEWSDWKYGDKSEPDWYSDAILVWAEMPDLSLAITNK